MTARVKKEFRVLLLPWSVAILTAFLLPVVTTLAGQMHRPYFRALPLGWVIALGSVCILVACLAMAAMSFGAEFHHRTFGLILVQPVERCRIWWSKMLPLIGAYISVGAAFVAGQYLAYAVWGSSFKSWNSSGLLVVVTLLAGVMCSSAFWTLQSRSIIGGMVLPLGIQALPAVLIPFFVSSRTMVVPEELESGLFLALGVSAFVYCVLFMYLGWRKFSRLEWREGFIGESVIAALPALRVKESQPTGSRGPWASLLRKELRLYWPVFSLAALFVVCWLAALGLRALRPTWGVQFEPVFGVILVIYLPFVWLLSGCISLGEEKQLGTWGWHLTLSVSRTRQWAIKISFALLIILILGILMPALACLAAKAPYIQMPVNWSLFPWHSPVWLALLVAVFSTILSFWSVTMFGTVVRAVLFTFLGSGVLFIGGNIMLRISQETFLFQEFWNWLIVEFQLLPYYPFLRWADVGGWFIGLSLLLVLLLRQSYVHCRCEPSRGVIIRCSLILVISLFLPLWLSSASTHSFYQETWLLDGNLGEAILKLPTSVKEDAIEKSKPVSLEEIDRTGMLHPETRRWLRGTTLRIAGSRVLYNNPAQTLFWVRITFPDGRDYDTVTAY